MLKKIISCLLIIIMIIGMYSNIYAINYNISSENFNDEEKYAEFFLQSINHTSTVSKPIPLYNIDNQLEAVCFDIDNGGYIIVNTNDLSIPELSFSDNKPFKDLTQRYIYNGALQYFQYKDDKLLSLYTNQIISKDCFETKYSKEKINKNDKINARLLIGSRGINIEEYLNSSLRTWYVSGGVCGPIAGAICLMYYDDYINDNYVSSSFENQNDLIPLMNDYMDTDCSGATSTVEVENGLNSYFTNYNISNSVSSYSTFSFNAVKSKININRPVIVDTDNHTTFGEHWIIVHGYFESIVDGNYIIVNNGWGNNNVWVSIDSTLDDIIYFNY